MICPNCKETIDDNSKFCEHCGAKIEQPQNDQFTQAPQNDQFAQAPQQQQFNNPLMQRKPVDKKVFVAIGALAAIIILAVVLVVTHKKKIDLNEYVTVNFSGYDTYGVATIDFDYDTFYADLEDKVKKSSKKSADYEDYDDLEELLSDYDWSDLADDFSDAAGYLGAMEGLSWSLDKESGLSNGDTIKLEFKFDNDAAKEYGIKYVGKTTEYTVSGLEEIREIDPFADIEVTFSGTSPNASASVENNSSDEALESLYYSVEPSYDLAKGDTVTVSVDADEEYMLETYGCKLTSTSKDYTCDNVDEYISDGKDISDEALEDMKDAAKDSIDAYFARD